MLPRFVSAAPPWRRLVPILMLVSAVAWAVPQQARATLCAGDDPGEVVFIGTVLEAPMESFYGTYEGVYRFSIDEVIAGDPGNGRAYNPQAAGGGGFRFQIGGLYEVHANRRTDAGRGDPAADLVTGSCFAVRTLADGPVRAAFGIARWAVMTLGPWVLLLAMILIVTRAVRRGGSAAGRALPTTAGE